MNRPYWVTMLGGVVLIFAGCGAAPKPAAHQSPPPAEVSGPALKEAELATVTLTPQAESRLGIRAVPVTSGRGNELRRFAADVMLPPGRSLIVAAPVSGTLSASQSPPSPGTVVKKDQIIFEITPLLALPRDLRVTAETEVEQAKTRVDTAKLRMTRADRMLKDQVGTVRAQEDARNELELATSALQAAQARLDQIKRAPLEGDVTVAIKAPRAGMIRQLLANPGQPVNGGSALFEIADLQTLWLRVPVYSGEAAMFSAGSAVRVETLSGQPIGTARPVQAPPTGDPLAATVDFYYEAPASSKNLKPGEKVSVSMVSRAAGAWNQVPFGAVVYDIHGGAWVYEKASDRRYVRHRVQIDHTTAGIAYLVSGPPVGTPVVVEGVAELWGVEFGVGH